MIMIWDWALSIRAVATYINFPPANVPHLTDPLVLAHVTRSYLIMYWSIDLYILPVYYDKQ